MKNIFVTVSAAAIAAAAFAVPAYAESYFELNAGPTFASGNIGATTLGSVSVGTDTGYNLGGGFGTTVDFLPQNWTVGAQVLYTSSGITSVGGTAVATAVPGASVDNATFSLMGVVNYHFDTGTALGLYVGGGLGMLQKELSGTVAGTTLTLSDRQFGWQGQAGIDYPLSDNAKIFAEYRYQGSSDWGINFPAGLGLPAGAVSISQETHNITMGIRFAM